MLKNRTVQKKQKENSTTGQQKIPETVVILTGQLSIESEDHFEIEGEEDTYCGTTYSPIMFSGDQSTTSATRGKNGHAYGSLDAIIRNHFPMLTASEFKITIEEL